MVKFVKKKTPKKKFTPIFLPATIILLSLIMAISYYHFFPQGISINVPEKDSEKISMGVPVNTDDMEVIVSRAFRGDEIYYYPGFFTDYCKARDGEIIIVEITVKNTADKPISVNHFSIIDTYNRRFESNNDFTSCIKSNYIMRSPRKINPGMDTTFASIYEIPKGKNTGYSMKITDKKFVELDFNNKYLPIR